MQPKEALFLVGPTASGKSAVAHHLALKLGKMVVSADSMNVYQGMDIGTAKPSLAEREAVSYVGVDHVNPIHTSHVADWLRAIQPAWASSGTPIVSGGTGMYISALIKGLDDAPNVDPQRRALLEGWSCNALQQEAQRISPEGYARMSDDDQLNPRRLIRLIERGEHTPTCWQEKKKATLIGLRWPRELLHARIEKRVIEMYAAGLLDEAEALMSKGLSETAAQAIGYAEAFAQLRGEIQPQEAQERTVIRTRQLAKRQMTWFRNQLDVHWIECNEQSHLQTMADQVEAGWHEQGSVEVDIHAVP